MAWISALIAAGSSIYGASESGSQARKAEKATERQAREQRELEELFFRLSRGGRDPESGFASALLPTYFGPQEEVLGINASQLFNEFNQQLGSPADQVARARVTLSDFAPVFSGLTDATVGEFTGANLQQRLANAQPVFDARVGIADAQANAIRDALNRRLGQVGSARTRGGFLGGSSFEQNQATRAVADAFSNAAQGRAASRFQNAADRRTILDQDLLNRLNSGAALQSLQNILASENLPASVISQGFQQRLEPFSFFRTAPTQFRPSPLPEIRPTLSTGQAVAAGLGGAASSYLDYSLERLANERRQPATLNTNSNLGPYDF